MLLILSWLWDMVPNTHCTEYPKPPMTRAFPLRKGKVVIYTQQPLLPEFPASLGTLPAATWLFLLLRKKSLPRGQPHCGLKLLFLNTFFLSSNQKG